MQLHFILASTVFKKTLALLESIQKTLLEQTLGALSKDWQNLCTSSEDLQNLGTHYMIFLKPLY